MLPVLSQKQKTHHTTTQIITWVCLFECGKMTFRMRDFKQRIMYMCDRHCNHGIVKDGNACAYT